MRSLQIVMLAPFGIRPKSTLSLRMLPLAQALVRQGHAVSIVAPPVHNPEDARTRILYDQVPVIHTSSPSLPGAASVFQQVNLLIQAALAEQPDIIHLFKPKGYSGLAALLLSASHPKIPLVVDTDDWEGWGGWNDLLPYPAAAKWLFAWQEHDLPRRATAVTVASRTLQTQVWGSGVAPERVIYIPNGIIPDNNVEAQSRDTQKQSHYTLLLYTRFWEFDVRYIVMVLIALATHRSDVRLHIVGKGERGEEQELLRLVDQAGLSHMVHYFGWVEPEQIPEHFAMADIALFPLEDQLITRAKCSAKLLELMAAGLPIIAGRVGQAAEYIEHNISGILVEPDDPAFMAQAILQLLDDSSLRTQLGAGACKRIQQFHWDLLGQDIGQLYLSILQTNYSS
ncbi:MAG: glycosyltransferase family 4 protein [Chloroflexota bacterium]